MFVLPPPKADIVCQTGHAEKCAPKAAVQKQAAELVHLDLTNRETSASTSLYRLRKIAIWDRYLAFAAPCQAKFEVCQESIHG
jgi:hypothetical protein